MVCGERKHAFSYTHTVRSTMNYTHTHTHTQSKEWAGELRATVNERSVLRADRKELTVCPTAQGVLRLYASDLSSSDLLSMKALCIRSGTELFAEPRAVAVQQFTVGDLWTLTWRLSLIHI